MPQTTNQLEHGGNSKRRKNVMKAQRWWQKLNGKMATLNPKPKGYLRPTYYEKGQGRDGYLRL